MKDKVIIYTDGSSRGNPGPGGWGAVCIFPNGKVVELGNREEMTTNNRMELSGVLFSLREIYFRDKKGDTTVEIFADSEYVIKGITIWIYSWEKNGWKTKANEPVLNQDLWKELSQTLRLLKILREVSFKKVAGHAGVPENERVDTIATMYAGNEKVLLFTGAFDIYKKMIEGEAKEKPKKSAKSSSQKAYSYVSLVAGKATVHKTWDECKKRVEGKKSVRFKKVFSKEEEEELIKSWS